MEYEVTRGGIEEDGDIRTALAWLASASGDPEAFTARLERAQESYRNITLSPEQLGQDPEIDAISQDVVGAFFAQAKSLVDDRRSYDFALGSRTIPWVKQTGAHVALLDCVPGARERASRMLRSEVVFPDGAIFELIMASNYAAAGFDVAFIDENKGQARTPDLRLSSPGLPEPLFVECKRLRRGKYEAEEQARHKQLFRLVAELIDERGLSVHVDVTYTRELSEVPDAYLVDRLVHALSSRIITPEAYPWRDDFGFGEVRPANLKAVRRDIRDSSLYFGTKLARLLSGRVVRENGYHLAAGADPDSRDPRYIDAIHFGSVVTWQCIAQAAIDKKSRYVKAKLVEADQQLKNHGSGIVHMAMDAELRCESSDRRRSRNIEIIKAFQPVSDLRAIYVHYLVPRISESHSWLVDETVDRFGPGHEPVPSLKIFSESTRVDNDLPAWKQEIAVSGHGHSRGT